MTDDEQRQLDVLQADLLAEFADRLPREVVAERVASVVRGFDGAAVRAFVPVLARRQARSELLASG